MITLKSIILPGALVLLLGGCAKDETPMVNEWTSAEVLSKSTGGLQWLKDESGEGNHQCPPNGNKCSKFEALAAGDKGPIRTVYTAVTGGNQQAIISAFTTHKTTLLKYIPQSLVNAVIQGQLVPTAFYNPTKGLHFLVFGNAPNEQVYQFNLN